MLWQWPGCCCTVDITFGNDLNAVRATVITLDPTRQEEQRMNLVAFGLDVLRQQSAVIIAVSAVPPRQQHVIRRGDVADSAHRLDVSDATFSFRLSHWYVTSCLSSQQNRSISSIIAATAIACAVRGWP